MSELKFIEGPLNSEQIQSIVICAKLGHTTTPAVLVAILDQLAAETLRADTAEAERNHAKEERDSYQRIGIAAEQRVSELETVLRKCANDLSGIGSLLKSFHAENESQWCGHLDDALGAARFRHAEACAALNPKPEAGSHD